VNNKFFADRNDFFKYDLLLEILEKSDLLRQLTFIPMLTPNDDRRGGIEQTIHAGSCVKNYSDSSRIVSSIAKETYVNCEDSSRTTAFDTFHTETLNSSGMNQGMSTSVTFQSLPFTRLLFFWTLTTGLK